MNNGKERKITVWGYKYDNGEIALLYHDTGTWRGKKINTVHVEYYQTTQAAVVRICELEAKIPSEDNFSVQRKDFKAGMKYLSDRCDMGVPIEDQSKEAQHRACAALMQMLDKRTALSGGGRMPMAAGRFCRLSVQAFLGIFSDCAVSGSSLHMVNP